MSEILTRKAKIFTTETRNYRDTEKYIKNSVFPLFSASVVKKVCFSNLFGLGISIIPGFYRILYGEDTD